MAGWFPREAACIAIVSCRLSQSSFGLAPVSTLLCTMQEAVRSRKSVGLWCVSPAKAVTWPAVGPFVYKEQLDRERARQPGLAFVCVCLQLHVHKQLMLTGYCGKIPT